MVNEDELTTRIRERAYRIWLEEGMPEGKADDHWELARLAIAQEDVQATMLVPVQEPVAESIETARNLGEFPTSTDQGEGQAYPSKAARQPSKAARQGVTESGPKARKGE